MAEIVREHGFNNFFSTSYLIDNKIGVIFKGFIFEDIPTNCDRFILNAGISDALDAQSDKPIEITIFNPNFSEQDVEEINLQISLGSDYYNAYWRQLYLKQLEGRFRASTFQDWKHRQIIKGNHRLESHILKRVDEINKDNQNTINVTFVFDFSSFRTQEEPLPQAINF